MDTAIHVGATISKKAVKEFKKSILSVLATSAGDEVKKEAIKALSSKFEVHGTSIMNCNFVTGKSKKSKKEE